MKLKRVKLQFLFILTLFVGIVQAHERDLADSLFTNLVKTHYSINDTLVQEFYVEYPEGYNEADKYPVFIGLAGGNQSEELVRYCYAVYFHTPLLKDYIKVFPIATEQSGMRSSSSDYFESILQFIKKSNYCMANGWLIAGTSNGGITALEMVTVNPSLFSGVITMPGIISGNDITVSHDWSHIKALLAYGEYDSEGWVQGVIQTDSIFRTHSILSKTLLLAGQGHILEMGYDIDAIYKAFFDLK